MVLNGQLKPSQALQIHIEENDVSRDFMPQGAQPDASQPISDEERSVEDNASNVTPQTQPDDTAPIPPAVPTPTAKVKQQTAEDLSQALMAQSEIKELHALKEAIDATRRQMWQAAQMKADSANPD